MRYTDFSFLIEVKSKCLTPPPPTHRGYYKALLGRWGWKVTGERIRVNHLRTQQCFSESLFSAVASLPAEVRADLPVQAHPLGERRRALPHDAQRSPAAEPHVGLCERSLLRRRSAPLSSGLLGPQILSPPVCGHYKDHH